MKRKWLNIGMIVCVLLIPIFLKLMSASPAKEFNVENAEPRAIKASILASGNLAYEEEARLSPEVIGKVTNILVKEGDRVDAGQIVMRMDERAYRAEVMQQEAAVRAQKLNISHQRINLDTQETQLNRKKDLAQRKFIALSQFDDARSAVDMAKVDLDTAHENLQQAQAVLNESTERLEKTTIRAPIAGIVTAIDIKVGETAVASQVGIPGSSLITIANTSTIIAEVNVDEADISHVNVGQDVAIYAASYPNMPLKGRVKFVSLASKRVEGGGSLGESSSLARYYAIKVSVENTAGMQLRPGMTCRAEIFTASTGSALTVPIQAIFDNSDANVESMETADNGRKHKELVKEESYVFINHNGVAEKRVVKVGISDDTYQEVTDGLKVGDAIITGPYKVLRHLKAGDHIKVSGIAESAPGPKVQ